LGHANGLPIWNINFVTRRDGHEDNHELDPQDVERVVDNRNRVVP